MAKRKLPDFDFQSVGAKKAGGMIFSCNLLESPNIFHSSGPFEMRTISVMGFPAVSVPT
jgi:hypothetical protein